MACMSGGSGSQPATFEPIGAPELMTPGAEHSFYPAAARGKLSFLGTHADINLWSVAIDAAQRHRLRPASASHPGRQASSAI